VYQETNPKGDGKKEELETSEKDPTTQGEKGDHDCLTMTECGEAV